MDKYNINFSNPKKKFSYCKTNTKCSVEHCNNPIFCKGYCTKHYAQIQHHGKIIDTSYNKNEIIEHDDYAEIIVRKKDGTIKGIAIIDLDDVDRCRRFKWGMYSNGYFYGSINKILRIRLHRFIMNAGDYSLNNIVDHIDRNPANNRKSNLRIVNSTINNRNKKVHNTDKDVEYKYPNIYLDKRRNMYYGRFLYKNKSYSTIGYKTQELAYNAVETLKKKVIIENNIDNVIINFTNEKY